tara:strand:- start:5089 stop:5730 length:642 start_codon:yes stop_codon:yes gene_type:complete
MNEPNSSDKKPTKSYSEKDQWNDDLDLPPLQHKKTTAKKPILEKADFDKKKKQPWKLYLSVIVIIVLGGGFYIFNSESIPENNTQKIHSVDAKIPDTIPDQIIPSIENKEVVFSEDTMVIEELMETEQVIPFEYEVQGPKNYHIIVGSFMNEANANHWLDLASFNEYGVQYVREYRGWYRVVFLSYSTVEQAEIEIDNIRNDLNLKAWIAYMN